MMKTITCKSHFADPPTALHVHYHFYHTFTIITIITRLPFVESWDVRPLAFSLWGIKRSLSQGCTNENGSDCWIEADYLTKIPNSITLYNFEIFNLCTPSAGFRQYIMAAQWAASGSSESGLLRIIGYVVETAHLSGSPKFWVQIFPQIRKEVT